MMRLAKGLLYLLILSAGIAIAILAFPIRYWASALTTLPQLRNNLYINQARGNLWQGSALLNIPVVGLNAPLRWQYVLPWSFDVFVGGGNAKLTPTTLRLNTAMTLAIEHPFAQGLVTIKSLNLEKTPSNAVIANAEIFSQKLNLTLAGMPVQLAQIQGKLLDSGQYTLSSEGDLTTQLQGKLLSLNPLKADISGTVKPALSNALLSQRIAATLPTSASGAYQFSRSFP